MIAIDLMLKSDLEAVQFCLLVRLPPPYPERIGVALPRKYSAMTKTGTFSLHMHWAGNSVPPQRPPIFHRGNLLLLSSAILFFFVNFMYVIIAAPNSALSIAYPVTLPQNGCVQKLPAQTCALALKFLWRDRQPAPGY
jgi:hypothetical protein